MQEITLPSITPQHTSESEGTFVVEPLYPGYGTTVGAALRRVLLSSLPGAAVSSARISGVDHEFSTISGVKEDALEVLLNLKLVRFRLSGDEPVTVNVTKQGPGAVTAGDIAGTDRLSIINPKQHLATLADKKTSFDAELTIEKGRGYLPVERREEQKLPVGTIAVDAVFTPVTRVTFEVENTRVGQMTNFDRLLLTIATDQTVEPEAALQQAAQILVSQFELFLDPSAAAVSQAGTSGPNLAIEDAGLSARATNALLNNDLTTMQDVAALSDSQLNNLKGFGSKAVDEVKAKLAELGLSGEAVA